jgi:hypothetical protein
VIPLHRHARSCAAAIPGQRAYFPSPGAAL